jgi:hypothetical protein
VYSTLARQLSRSLGGIERSTASDDLTSSVIECQSARYVCTALSGLLARRRYVHWTKSSGFAVAKLLSACDYPSHLTRKTRANEALRVYVV